MKKLITILVLLWATVVQAGEGTKLAVTEIQARRGVDPVLAKVIEEFLVAQVARIGSYQVIGQDDILRMLGHEQQKQMTGCDDDSCLAEIGGALGVDKLLGGSMDKVGDSLLITLKLINIRTAQVERREAGRLQGATEEDALDAVTKLFSQMFRSELASYEPPERLWTWIAAGGAGALVITGAVLVGVGYADANEAQRLADKSATNHTYYSEITTLEKKSQDEKVAGGVILGVGGAAAVTAILLYFFEVDDDLNLAVVPTVGRDLTFAGVSFGGTF